MNAISSGKTKRPGLIFKSISNAADFRFSIDTIVFFSVIICANLHLLSGDSCRPLIFLPAEFCLGDGYRLLTFSFVHVSGYHLALDAGAFLLLYSGLAEKRTCWKLFYVGFCGVSGLAAAVIFDPSVYTRGLCGLSGIAHGLMAISALEMIADRKAVGTGWVLLVIVCGKSLYEAVTGDVLFAFMHLDLCGSPVAVCHAGGVAGGILSYSVMKGLVHSDSETIKSKGNS